MSGRGFTRIVANREIPSALYDGSRSFTYYSCVSSSKIPPRRPACSPAPGGDGLAAACRRPGQPAAAGACRHATAPPLVRRPAVDLAGSALRIRTADQARLLSLAECGDSFLHPKNRSLTVAARCAAVWVISEPRP